MKNMKAIVIDTETTGITLEDEILQVSIVDYEGKILFNEYMKPQRYIRWPEAEAIHGISPEMVKDCKTIDDYMEKIQGIIDSAELLIGYNLYFDLNMLKSKGLHIPKEVRLFDVMHIFPEIYGEWDDYHQDYKWQKLTTCAAYYGYTWEEDAHNALGDVKATLYCYKKMNEAAGKE